MKLYTIQHESVYHKILKNKVYTTDKRFICSKSFQKAYEWMSKMMKKYRVGSSRPIFCYVDKPDLRVERYSFSDTRKAKSLNMVLLEIEVPDERVLISDFSLWHFVLNDYSIFFGSEEEVWEGKEKTKSYIKFKEKSWERCLVLPQNDFSNYPKDLQSSGMKQACIPEIKQEYIKKVTPFILINKAKK